MIIVLGATGNTGGALVKELKAAGADFKCVVRDVERAKKILGNDVDCVQGDLSDYASLVAAFQGGDTLFLHSGHSPAIEEQQINGVNAAKEAGIGTIVKVAGAEGGMHPDCPSHIMRMHHAVEQAVMDSGLSWTILRPGFFMQNVMAAIPAIKAKGIIPNPFASDRKVNMIHTADTAAVAAKVLTGDGHDGKIYALYGNEISFAEIAAELSSQLGREIKHVQIPKQAMLDTMRENNMPDWLIAHMSATTGLLEDGGMNGDTATLAGLLGREPTGFAQFVSEKLPAFKA